MATIPPARHIVAEGVDHGWQALGQDLIEASRMPVDLRAEDRGVPRQVSSAARDKTRRTGDRFGGGSGGGVQYQGYQHFVGAAQPGEVFRGRCFAQLEAAGALQPGSQQDPVKPVAEIHWLPPVVVDHGDVLGNAPPDPP